jgi:hypothetical protein
LAGWGWWARLDGRRPGRLEPAVHEDAAAAKATVATLGALRFETLLVGQGDPITSGASAQVAKLAAG